MKTKIKKDRNLDLTPEQVALKGAKKKIWYAVLFIVLSAVCFLIAFLVYGKATEGYVAYLVLGIGFAVIFAALLAYALFEIRRLTRDRKISK
jgi:inner membrane protein involved in colicin E2 resistance